MQPIKVTFEMTDDVAVLAARETLRSYGRRLFGWGATVLIVADALVLSRMRVGLLVSAVEYINAQKVRTLIQHDFADVFRRVDALLAPTCPMIAPRVGETSIACGTAQLVPRRVLARLSQPVNLAGVPAISLPCGFVDGLPVGLQIIAPAWAEATVLRVARAYERETDWHRHVPRLDD